MACLSDHHKTLNAEGVGKCSVPSWSNGCPDGFCDRPAFGRQEPSQMRYGAYINGVFHAGYCTGLACYEHGGPNAKEV